MACVEAVEKPNVSSRNCKMIRSSVINLDYSNTGKKETVYKVMIEYRRVVNEIIEGLWEEERFSGKFVAQINVDTWLSARMKQCAAKQALQIVKSQRKKDPEDRTMPVLNKLVMDLDERFVQFHEDNNTFDLWVRLSSIGDRTILWLPSKKHEHFHKFRNKGWKQRRGVRIVLSPERGLIAHVYFEKPEPAKRTTGREVGIDIGYKKLVVTSDGEILGDDLEQVILKTVGKKRNSKAYKRCLRERDALVDRTVKKFVDDDIKTVVVEDLKNVQRGKKGKMSRKTNNKLQYWAYRRFLDRLELCCEEHGVRVLKVNPAFTSQTCHACGNVDKKARRGESYKCPVCGLSTDADYNAAQNILIRGLGVAYSRPFDARTCQ